MTIYKSHQVNLDPEPWVNERGERASVAEWAARAVGFGDDSALSEWARDPRPEFEPTRDPLPHACQKCSGRWPAATDDPRHGPSVWAPRREQFDTPVNWVLVLFRERDEPNANRDDAAEWLERLRYSGHANYYEIEHARKVLTRLALGHAMRGWNAEPQPFPTDLQLPMEGAF